MRTSSGQHPAFNPFAYHRGTVWPVENAMFVLALAGFGLGEEMNRLAKATFESAALFKYHRSPGNSGCGRRLEFRRDKPGMRVLRL